MWAYFVKDIKQNARWGLLAAIVLSGLLPYYLYSTRSQYQSIVNESFQSTAAVAFAVAGLALGLAVMLTDGRRGHWDFSVHRPVSRWKIYCAKNAAALSLYVVASGAAVGVTTLCAMAPRFTLTAFSAPMLLPIFYYQISGMMWLAGGLVVATRKARWIGGRTLPLAAVMGAALLINGYAIYFYEAALAAVGVAVFFVICAGVLFAHNGVLVSSTRTSQIAIGLLLGSGVAALLMLATSVAMTAWQMSHGDVTAFVRDSYVLDRKGNVYRQDNHGRSFKLDGRPLDSQEDKWLSENKLETAGAYAMDPDDLSNARLVRYYSANFLRPGNYLAAVGRDGYPTDVHWVYVGSRHTLEAYSPAGILQGSMGPNGYASAATAAMPFPNESRLGNANGNSEIFLNYDAATVYVVDLKRRTTRTFPTHTSAAIVDLKVLRPLDQRNLPLTDDLFDPRYPSHAIFTSRNEITVMPVLGGPPTVTIPFKNESDLYFQTGIDDKQTVQVIAYRLILNDRDPTPVEWISADATHIERQPLPMLTPRAFPVAASDAGRAVAYPPILTALWWFYPTGPQSLPPGSIGVAIGSALLASIFANVIARRKNFSRCRRIVWIVLSLTLGLIAPFTLLCVHQWPAKVRCPACGKLQAVDREFCAHCAAPFERPAEPSIEVFEHEPMAA